MYLVKKAHKVEFGHLLNHCPVPSTVWVLGFHGAYAPSSQQLPYHPLLSAAPGSTVSLPLTAPQDWVSFSHLDGGQVNAKAYLP